MPPLSKLWALYQHSLDNPKNDQNLREKGKRYGLRGLWYVRLCLRR